MGINMFSNHEVVNLTSFLYTIWIEEDKEKRLSSFITFYTTQPSFLKNKSSVF